MRNEKNCEGHCRGVLGECESAKELASSREAEECAPILRGCMIGHRLYGVSEWDVRLERDDTRR